MRKALAWLSSVAVMGAVAGYFLYLRPELLTLRQVSNHARCQGAEAWVQRQRELTGAYPTSLPENLVTDAWGHPLQYTRLADGYLIVSFGRDGKPDGSNYLVLREAGDHPAGYSICGNFDADEVVSDKGWHRICGK